MENIISKIKQKDAELDELILEIAAFGKAHSHYPHYHLRDLADKCMIYVAAAQRKLRTALCALQN